MGGAVPQDPQFWFKVSLTMWHVPEMSQTQSVLQGSAQEMEEMVVSCVQQYSMEGSFLSPQLLFLPLITKHYPMEKECWKKSNNHVRNRILSARLAPGSGSVTQRIPSSSRGCVRADRVRETLARSGPYPRLL